MKTACVLGALLAVAACGDTKRPEPGAAPGKPGATPSWVGETPEAPGPSDSQILEQAIDHFDECVKDTPASDLKCTSCHDGGDAGQSLAKVLVGGEVLDLCVPGLM